MKWNKIKVELDLSNYVIKYDIKHAIGTDTSYFAKKTDQAGVKSKVDKLAVDYYSCIS